MHKHLLQILAVNGLGQIIIKSRSDVLLPCAGECIGGQRYTWHAFAHIVLKFLHCSQGLESIHLRHSVINKNSVVALFYHLLKSLFSALGSVYNYPRPLKKSLNDRQIHDCIINHKDLRIRSSEALVVLLCALEIFLVTLLEISDGFPGNHLLPDLEGEVGALSVYALHLKLCIHKGQELLDDAHAKSGSFNGAVPDLFDSLKG